ncbi:hypothetical protein D3C77_361310 [compost metagenome]
MAILAGIYSVPPPAKERVSKAFCTLSVSSAMPFPTTPKFFIDVQSESTSWMVRSTPVVLFSRNPMRELPSSSANSCRRDLVVIGHQVAGEIPPAFSGVASAGTFLGMAPIHA